MTQNVASQLSRFSSIANKFDPTAVDPGLVPAIPLGMEQLAALLPPPPAPTPPAGDLDHWTMQQFEGRLADELEGGELEQLVSHVVEVARRDKKHWAGRDSRMRAEQEMFALAQNHGVLGHDHQSDDELEAMNAQTVTLNDPFVLSRKMAAMVSGAGITFNMPAMSLSATTAAQAVENYCLWFWEELRHQQMFSGGTDPLRLLAHYAVVRGWICALILPNATNPDFPYTVDLPDPMTCYPRFTNGKGLARMTKQYCMTVLEARYEYPEADAMLQGREDDDEVEIISYYDQVYQINLLTSGGSSVPNGASASASMLIGQVYRHEVTDFSGRPVTPWTTIIPNGDLSGTTGTAAKRTELYGPGCLFAIKGIYSHFCRLVAMSLTQVAKSVDPPMALFYRDGKAVPAEVVLEPGTTNYMLFGDSDIKPLMPTANPQDMQVLWAKFEDQMDRAGLPKTFYGHVLSGISGYTVNLLNAAANDNVQVYGEGVQEIVMLLLRRMLEITLRITSQTTGNIQYVAPQGFMQRRVAGQSFNPSIIQQTGVSVEVKLGAVTPANKAEIANYVLGLVGAGIIPRYDARVELGYKDPLLMFDRQSLESLVMNPQIAAILGPLSAAEGDPAELLVRAFQEFMNLAQQQQMQQANPEEAVRQAGNPPQLKTSTLPTER